ncbi:flavodoxin family protein [Oceanirhabdus seepicola]|uniref:Flavodoxin family protein n=1 Tax=Oceanirhabdus seepicola TaxID=2828781 RepID=A0A9J6NWG2_9CLOT|nr:flavodoxin family protein [Oceanirhabdus seepicola]MCM1988257.1 flavodoxin family protein [Oceanirhabdus seepicola]
MKTLIINGSPRKNGDTMTLINEMKKYLNGEVEIINTYYDNISPCIDCRYCWENNGCAINDEMQKVYRLLNEVDNVIIASPIYFSQLTGKLLSFASRLQCFFVSRCLKKDSYFQLKRKKGALLITGGGDGSPELGIRSANIIFRQMNAESIGTVSSLKTNKIPAKEHTEALSKAREFALRLNELNK